MLQEIESKLQTLKQACLELRFKKQVAKEKVEQLKVELGGVTAEQLTTQKQVLDNEASALSGRVNEISQSLKNIL